VFDGFSRNISLKYKFCLKCLIHTYPIINVLGITLKYPHLLLRPGHSYKQFVSLSTLKNLVYDEKNECIIRHWEQVFVYSCGPLTHFKYGIFVVTI